MMNKIPIGAKPILFNTEMTRGVLAGAKTMTRRVIKPQPTNDSNGMWHWRDCQWMDGGLGFPQSGIADHAPYRPNDALYVRETFHKDVNRYMYKANYSENEKFYRDGEEVIIKWTPSIHMPREAARIFLLATNVRVERVQDITDEDAKKEGCADREDFHRAWNECYSSPRPVKGKDGAVSHYESYPWEDIRETRTYKGKPWYVIGNPWVWAISFERNTSKEIKEENL